MLWETTYNTYSTYNTYIKIKKISAETNILLENIVFLWYVRVLCTHRAEIWKRSLGGGVASVLKNDAHRGWNEIKPLLETFDKEEYIIINNNTMSEKKFKRYLITSALPYANGPVHIGHLAGVDRKSVV